MEIIYPSNFNINLIDKCMVDELCTFIKSNNIESAINERIGTIFVILKETYFSVYTAKHNNILCNYNCRNFVITHLYPKRGNDIYYENLVNNNFGLRNRYEKIC